MLQEGIGNHCHERVTVKAELSPNLGDGRFVCDHETDLTIRAQPTVAISARFLSTMTDGGGENHS